MTNDLKRTLQGALTLALVLAAVEARAQKLETPGAPAAEAAAPAVPSGPVAFGDGGQLMLSIERLFGYTYAHESNGFSANTYTLLSAPFGDNASAYDWPRLAFDYFLTKGISAGATLSFFRTADTQDGRSLASVTGFEVAPRLGYATMVGPWLGVWPRVGATYVYRAETANTFKDLGLVVDLQAVIVASPRLLVTFGPTLNYGLSGSDNGNTLKSTDLGVDFGVTIPL